MVSNTAGSLDAGFLANRISHQPDVLNGRSAGAETGAGLDEMRFGLYGEFAGGDDLFVVEISSLNDDFHPPIFGRLDDIA